MFFFCLRSFDLGLKYDSISFGNLQLLFNISFIPSYTVCPLLKLFPQVCSRKHCTTAKFRRHWLCVCTLQGSSCTEVKHILSIGLAQAAVVLRHYSRLDDFFFRKDCWKWRSWHVSINQTTLLEWTLTYSPQGPGVGVCYGNRAVIGKQMRTGEAPR